MSRAHLITLIVLLYLCIGASWARAYVAHLTSIARESGYPRASVWKEHGLRVGFMIAWLPYNLYRLAYAMVSGE
jgi:hypothetical protein